MASREICGRLRVRSPGICRRLTEASLPELLAALTGPTYRDALRMPIAAIPRRNVPTRTISGRLLRMDTPHSNTLGVLLAAGSGTRFSGPHHKLLSEIEGQTVISRSLTAMTGSGLDGFIVVSGALDLSNHIGDLEEVHNSEWKTGQRSSVIAAMNFARNHGYDAIVVGLADQPFLTSEAWNNVASSTSPIAVATYNGTRGNPVRIHSSVWDTFEGLQTDADAGARSLIHLHPELVREVACEGNSADIDTTEDLDTWT